MAASAQMKSTEKGPGGEFIFAAEMKTVFFGFFSTKILSEEAYFPFSLLHCKTLRLGRHWTTPGLSCGGAANGDAGRRGRPAATARGCSGCPPKQILGARALFFFFGADFLADKLVFAGSAG
jgi:hypothetical protein